MSINAINGVTSATSIDWGNLTAKKILQYKSLGVDVPAPYLLWAQSFINNVNSGDQDETTYNAATSATVTKKYNGVKLRYEATNRSKELEAMWSELISTTNKGVKAENESNKNYSGDLKDNISDRRDRASNINSLLDSVNNYGDKKQAREVLKQVGQSGLSEIQSAVSIYEDSSSILDLDRDVASKGISYAKQMGNDDLTKEGNSLSKNIRTGLDDLKDYISDTTGLRNDLSEETGVFQAKTQSSSSSSSSGSSTSSNNSNSNSSKSNSTKTKSTLTSTKSTDSGSTKSTDSASTKSTTTASATNVDKTTATKDSSPNDKVSSTKEDELQSDKVIKEKKQEDKKEIRTAQNDGTDKDDKLHTDLNTIMNYKIRTGKYNATDA